MKYFLLKSARVILALFIFIPLLFFFIDFTDALPNSFHAFAHLQLIPAILGGSLGIFLILIVLTLLFGRIYCSVICPLGVLQDIISWFTKRGKKKKWNKKKRWYHYQKPYNLLRYSLLAICIIFLAFGVITPLLFLDPYSNFGRIAVNIFRPIVMEGNNLLNWIALKFDNYSLYHVSIYTITIASFSISLIVFLVVGIMSFLRGRLFCNTICPVGSFLGILSRFSLFRIVIDKSKCIQCGQCEKSCKAGCISTEGKYVDSSRCIDCFNCLNRCSKYKAIDYKFIYAIKEKTIHEEYPHHKQIDTGKRNFLLTSAAIAGTVPLLSSCKKWVVPTDPTKLTPITPPGSLNLTRFKEKCTACHLCVTHCPQQILKPAGFEFGINYAFKPHMFFYEKGFCNYNCTICSEVCPNHAIISLTEEEKKKTQVGIAKFQEDLCIVITEHTSCGACSEHCPTQAVKMEPYRNGLTLPLVYEKLCIGCGGCESICPVKPIKAINVLANEVHKKVELPQEEELEEINVEELDFGF
ncbi:MAG: 4Fe-4S binding protein [Bacteroidales bacterium]|nr:4Fe-4S binding protein [Bacteroidales bacterium]